jgi:hypothetical protein
VFKELVEEGHMSNKEVVNSILHLVRIFFPVSACNALLLLLLLIL